MENYEELIYNFLLHEFEGNKFAVCGIMGNLKAESNLNPINLQNSYEKSLGMTDEQYTKAVMKGEYSKDQFVYDHAGYGLCQWTFWSRKQGLYEHCYKSTSYDYIFKVDIGNPILQLDYMMIELKQNKSLYDKLLKCEDVADSAEWFCLEFEKPAGGEKSVPKRIEYALDYWNRLANKDTEDELKEENEFLKSSLKDICNKLDKIYIMLKERYDGRTE